MLDYHNKLRTGAYKTPPLVWDAGLEAQASTYAAKCVFAHSNPGNPQYGENLAVSGTSANSAFPYVTWKAQLDGWKAEESSWTCSSNACSSGAQCGHQTAMIWNGTTNMGCGIGKCPPGTIYSTFYSQLMVCQYSPPGNWVGIHPITGKAGTCNTCPTLPTPQIIPSGGAPTAPTVAPTQPPAAPLGTTKPKPPTPTPTPTKKPTPTSIPTAPGAPAWAKCVGDYWPGGVQQLTPCNAQPQTFNAKLYCDVKDPQKYLWPVYNPGTADCNFVASLTEEGDASRDGILSTPAWIGIAVGSAAFIIIVIIIIIVVKKRSEDERV